MSVEEARNFKEELLGRDIRQLGRMLGETIRAQEGDGVFERIESIRKSSIGFRRDEDGSAHEELAAILAGISSDERTTTGTGRRSRSSSTRTPAGSRTATTSPTRPAWPTPATPCRRSGGSSRRTGR